MTPITRLMLRRLPVFLLVLGLSSVNAQGAQHNTQGAPLRIIATVGMIADLTTEIGGDCVTVQTMIGSGLDPHLYRASAGDVTRLAAADLILYNGHNLEGQLGEVFERLGSRTPTVAVAERGIPGELLRTVEVGSDEVDPHVWMTPALWSHVVPVIKDTIAELRPACTDEVATRAEDYQAQLVALHDWAVATMATVPQEHRFLVTAHDAFNYFGAAYGLELAAIEGISTESEASIADIREAAEVVVRTGVPAIFIENTINPRTIEAVRAAARDRGAEVAIGGELLGDAMGDIGTPEGSYIGMVRHNVLTIAVALGGEALPLPAELEGWATRWGL